MSIANLRPSALLSLYVDRLRGHLGQELAAMAGIAAGVALLFGVLVANTSITSSASQLVHSITGRATLRIASRSSEGFDVSLAARAGNLPSVKVAAPLLRQPATITGPDGSEQIQLVGVTPVMTALHAEATRNLGEGAGLLGNSGVGLPSSVGEAVGARAGEHLTVLTRGLASTVPISVVLGSQTVGAIANSPVAVVLLSTAQRLTGLHGRVTEVLIEPQPGRQQTAERELRHLASTLDVGPVDSELRVLAQAAGPNSQSTTLFAGISAIVGCLIAFNAVLLTVPERRRWLHELLEQGYDRKQLFIVMASQACVLGLIGSLVGLGIGYLLSQTLFRALPVYLTFAFPLGANSVIKPTAVLVALVAGIAAALCASLLPLLDTLRARSIGEILNRDTGEPGQGISVPAGRLMAVLAVSFAVVATVLALLVPAASIVSAVFLALAAILVAPSICALMIRLLARVGENIRGSMIGVAAEELSATAIRSAGMACMAALAIYGLVAVGGARSDLTHGLNQAIHQYLDTAEVWVTPRGENAYTTDSFSPDGLPARIARVPGVASVRLYGGALLDVGDRRLWIRARPSGDPTVLQSTQLMAGNYALASKQIRSGGWAAVSGAFAAEHHLKIGSRFTLPTPSGTPNLRVAAITTNAGWPPGAITISAADYRRYWQTSSPAAIEVSFKPGYRALAAKQAVAAAIGRQPALQVQTSVQREDQFKRIASQALSRLSEIATLLLIAGALAVAAALIAGIVLRRTQIAELKDQGFDHIQIMRLLLVESSAVLAVGCLDGALFGLYGHALADRWLTLTTGYPAPWSPGWPQIVTTIALTAGIALAFFTLASSWLARTAPFATSQE